MQAAGWFGGGNQCAHVNLLGRNLATNDDGNYPNRGIYVRSWRGMWHSMNELVLAIRPDGFDGAFYH